METLVKSDIEAVTVYSSGAVITRAALLEPTGGVWPRHVRIADLPLALDDASVKVRAEGNGGPTAVSFRVALEVLDGAAVAEPPEEEAWRTARKEVRVLEARLQDLERLIGRVTQMSLPTRPAPRKGEAPPPSPHAGRMAMIEFRQQRLAALGSAAEDLRHKLRTAREVLADVEDRKRRASAAREPRQNELRKTVVVTLSAAQSDGADRVKLLLEYHVPGARWAPAYSFHFDQDFARATLSARAVVAQRTGEDWKNVRLTLSTAQMQAWTELPELASLRLGRWQPPPRSGWRPLPPGAEELYSDYDRECAGRRKEAVPEEAATDTGAVTLDAVVSAPAFEEEPRVRPPVGAPRGLGAIFASAREARPAPVPRPHATPSVAAQFTRMFSAPEPPAPERATRPAPASLDYSALHMPGPCEADRGKLTRTELATRVEIFTEVQVKVRVDTVSVVQEARSDAARLGGLPPEHDFPSSVEGFDYAYRADLPVDIPSDGRFHSIPILAREAEARPYYVTVPRETPDVFRFAEIDNPLDAPLLPGPADIYVGNTFLMTAPLRLTPAAGVIKLGVGVEQRIKVARNTAFAEEAAGLMGGTLNLKHDIDIELRNLLRVPAQIEVRERVPVTRDGEEHLKVTASAKPPWEPYDPPEGSLRGGHAWKVRVQPSEVIHLHAAYSVGMPARMEIATGNRREQ